MSTTTHARPRVFLHTLIYDELEGLRVLWACHWLCLNAVDVDIDLRRACDARLLRMLDRVARRYPLTLATLPTAVGGYSTGFQFVEIVSLVSEDVLRGWASDSPESCCQMVAGLRHISYSMPDACRLLQILDPQVVSRPKT
ncbi:hypothetical protein JCM10212_006421, partial [Sporobolomyces blumeae]